MKRASRIHGFTGNKPFRSDTRKCANGCSQYYQLGKSTIARIWSDSQKVAAGRLLFALFACGLLAYAAAFAWHMLTSFDLVNIIREVNFDDAFYYFQIAYNLAQGKFSTFDGGITQTNGYHPVWMLLITPFYLIFDKETALFGIKALEIMLVAGGVAGAPGVAVAVRCAADALSQPARASVWIRSGSGDVRAGAANPRHMPLYARP